VAGRERYTQPGGSCLPGSEGGYMDSSALRRRYVAALKRANLCALRFHDLCHIFGSLAINYASIVPVLAWMGRADVNTTMRYLEDKSRADDAGLFSYAFRANGDDADGALARRRERALDVVAVGLDRDPLLAQVHARADGPRGGVGRAYFFAASK
jgi:hypothetical protein